MKIPTGITRLLLYAILCLAVLAVFTVLRNLYEPSVEFPSDSLTFNTLMDSIESRNEELIASRSGAINQLGEHDVISSSPDSRRIGTTSVDAELLESITDGIETSIMTSPSDAVATAGGFIPESLRVNDNIDTANSIFVANSIDSENYFDSVANRVFETERHTYIEYLTYYELTKTLGRDLIRYQAMNELAFHDLKETLYRTERDTKYGELYLIRSDAQAQWDAGLSAIDHRHFSYIQVLKNQLSIRWSDQLEDSAEVSLRSGMMQDLHNRLPGFSPVGFYPSGVSVQAPGWIDERASWLDAEAGITDSFASGAVD